MGSYSQPFSLYRLVPGVDNIRYDVHVSSDFVETLEKIMFKMILQQADANRKIFTEDVQNVKKETDGFKSSCFDVMQSAMEKAKLLRENQVNFLCIAAIAKLVHREAINRFNAMVNQYMQTIRGHEISSPVLKDRIILLKKELSVIQKRRPVILRCAVGDIFRLIWEVYEEKIRELCVTNFGANSVLGEDVFSNPILHADNDVDTFFMSDEYVLLDYRNNSPLNKDTVTYLLEAIYSIVGNQQSSESQAENDVDELQDDSQMSAIDRWINCVDNAAHMFDYFQTKDAIKNARRNKRPKSEIQALKALYKDQKRILSISFKLFNKAGLIKRITAFYEMQSFYVDHCPPLSPHDILEFLTVASERRSIAARIRRLKSSNARVSHLNQLNQHRMELRRVKTLFKRKYLIRFFYDFTRFYRDSQNYALFKDAMENINLVKDDATIKLSRTNHTLYDFILKDSQIDENRPILRHVIIKADVRGSTDITYQIKERGLNPAYYFSQNFFDPITKILPEYGASKVFIEGDAIILSIFEHENIPLEWYCVSRACGLAINILLITRRYNVKGRQAKLPRLEQGIGISYIENSPSFLFDGDNRIMISSAINLADRLSGCSKVLRKRFANNKPPFNLYVFKSSEMEDDPDSVDDQFIRYNLNGIQLNEPGFKKLCEEISLKRLEFPLPNSPQEKSIIYTGKFPVKSGGYQRLVIREGLIPEVSPDDFNFVQMTDMKYYEVCTNSRVYEFAKKKG